MGRRNIYTTTPKKPRAAKIAWEYFKKYGELSKMWYDATTDEWVAQVTEAEGTVAEICIQAPSLK